MTEQKSLQADILKLRNTLFSWMEYTDMLINGDEDDDAALDELLRKAVLETKDALGSKHIASFLGQ